MGNAKKSKKVSSSVRVWNAFPRVALVAGFKAPCRAARGVPGRGRGGGAPRPPQEQHRVNNGGSPASFGFHYFSPRTFYIYSLCIFLLSKCLRTVVAVTPTPGVRTVGLKPVNNLSPMRSAARRPAAATVTHLESENVSKFSFRTPVAGPTFRPSFRDAAQFTEQHPLIATRLFIVRLGHRAWRPQTANVFLIRPSEAADLNSALLAHGLNASGCVLVPPGRREA